MRRALRMQLDRWVRFCLVAGTASACACGSEGELGTPQDLPLTADFPEVYRAGGSDAPDWAQFIRPGPASFDGSGNLYILDPFASQVVVLDPQGRPVGTIGGAGEGPGEFSFPYHLAVWRDGRLAVWDIDRGAIQVFGPGGEFDRTVGMDDHLDLTPSAIRPEPSGGALYAQGSSMAYAEIDEFSIVRIDLAADEAASDRVLRARRARGEDPPEEPSWSDVLDSSGEISVARTLMVGGALDGVFFEPTLRWDILPDGTIAYADSSSYAVQLLVPGGPEVEVPLRQIPPAAVSDRLRSAAIEQQIDRYTRVLEGQGGMPDYFREGIEERGFYPEVPVIGEMRSTWDGGLWIRRPAEEPWNPEGTVDVFDPDRRYVGTFAASAMPAAFGPDGLVAYWELGEMDVPSIVVKRLPVEVR